MIIAIDGPAGSGKSTVAKLVAQKLGFAYLDTGAMYRAVAYRALANGVSVDDDAALTRIALDDAISFGFVEGEPVASKVFIAGLDVTKEIRTPQVDVAVSPVSAVPAVREALVEQQQRIGSEQDTVMEGRDIGTVVFPHAELKIFLTATPEVRAERRLIQNAQRFAAEGKTQSKEEVLESIIRRDKYDSERETSPLRPADDALELDSSPMSIEEVVDWIVAKAHERKAQGEETR